MKKLLLISAATLIVSNSTFAGGILTNTNQHAAFLRMLSRGATTEIDGALSNPAGLAFLPKDGFHVGLDKAPSISVVAPRDSIRRKAAC